MGQLLLLLLSVYSSVGASVLSPFTPYPIGIRFAQPAVVGGSLVVVGGGGTIPSFSVNRSDDGGSSWRVYWNAPFLPRGYGHGTTVWQLNAASPQYIVMMGGYVCGPSNNGPVCGGPGGCGFERNKVWTSTNLGETWSSTTVPGLSPYFDPTSGCSGFDSNLPMNRDWHAMVAAQASPTDLNKHLYVLGGTGMAGRRRDVWAFGTSWSQRPDLPQTRWGHSAVAVDDGTRIVVAGGMADSSAVDTVWISNVGVTAWTALPPIPGSSPANKRAGIALAVIDYNLWLIGGMKTLLDFNQPAFNDIYVSTDVGRTWLQVSANASWSARGGQGVAVIGRQLLLIGGTVGTSPGSTEVWKGPL